MPLGYKEPPEYRPEGTDAQLEELVGAEKIDRSALPEDERSPYITDAQAEAREVHFDQNRWKLTKEYIAKSKGIDPTENQDKYCKYKSRPFWQTALFGALAVALFVGQWFMPEIFTAMDESARASLGGYIGTIRFCMMFVGAYCLFMAWPEYKIKGLSDEEAETRQTNKEDFRRKFRR